MATVEGASVYGSNEQFAEQGSSMISGNNHKRIARNTGVLMGVTAVLARTISRSFSSVFSAHLNQTIGFSSFQFWMFLAMSASVMVLMAWIFGTQNIRNDVRKGFKQLFPASNMNEGGLPLSQWLNLMVASIGSDLGFLFVSMSVMYISAADAWCLGVGISAVLTPLCVACIFGWHTLTVRLMIAIVLCITGTMCICKPSFIFHNDDESLNLYGVLFALFNAMTELKNVSIQWLKSKKNDNNDESQSQSMNDNVLTFSRLILSAFITLFICIPYFTMISPHEWINPLKLPRMDLIVFLFVAMLDTLSVFGVTIAVSNLGANGFTIGRQTLLIFALLFENVVYHSTTADLSFLTLFGMFLTLSGVAVSVVDRMNKASDVIADATSDTDYSFDTAAKEYEEIVDSEGDMYNTTPENQSDAVTVALIHSVRNVTNDVDIYDDHIERI